MPFTRQHKTQDLGDISKQRASKACNRCRAKKSRCSGGYPCSKCKSADAPCIFGYPKESKRKVFPEHYVRTLEMQQYKLVAGLHTMYFMLLATNSWPGEKLPECKGNPLVHDILNRLGLLETGKKQQVLMDLDEDEDESDTSHNDASPASTTGSPERPPHDLHIPTEPRPGDLSASPQRSTSQQQLCSDGSSNRLNAQPLQCRPYPLSSFALPLPTDFALKPPPKMTLSFPDNSPPAQNVGTTTSWSGIDCSEAWWQRSPQTTRHVSSSSSGFASGSSANRTADTSGSEVPATHNPDLYLVDPGVYFCDFDLDC